MLRDCLLAVGVGSGDCRAGKGDQRQPTMRSGRHIASTGPSVGISPQSHAWPEFLAYKNAGPISSPISRHEWRIAVRILRCRIVLAQRAMPTKFVTYKGEGTQLTWTSSLSVVSPSRSVHWRRS